MQTEDVKADIDITLMDVDESTIPVYTRDEEN
jgi:hypothetical protein